MRRALGWTQIALLACGALLLSYCGFVLVDAWVFQQRQSRELARLLENHSRPARVRALPAVVGGMLGARGLIGRLEIPRLGLSAILIEGDDQKTLRRAVGHIPGTPLPGQPGNAALTGHRDTFFRPLRNVHDDITGAITLAAAVSAARVCGSRLRNQRVVIVGAGTAGAG